MTERGAHEQSTRAARVELFEHDEINAELIVTPVPDGPPSRWPIVAMAVGFAVLVGGLWWAASFTSIEGDAALPADAPNLDVRPRLIDDEGRWTPAIFSAPHLDGGGFVGLSNTGGQVHLIESSDGFTIDFEQTTDFPFGYFTNALQTTAAGYHVIGHLARIEDAVFTSHDGQSWERFEIEVPLPATALGIEHFHRGARSAALVGSLGSAGNFSPSEPVAMWWGSDGRQIVIPEHPCGSADSDCAITSLISVDDGILVTHERDRSAALSKWSMDGGWTSLARVDPDPLENATLFATSNDAVWFLRADRIVRSDDGGRNWDLTIEKPPGERGRFLGVSESGLAAVFQTDTDLWFLAGGSWSQHPLGEVTIGRLLAVTDDAALLTGSSPDGSVGIRLVPLGT